MAKRSSTKKTGSSTKKTAKTKAVKTKAVKKVATKKTTPKKKAEAKKTAKSPAAKKPATKGVPTIPVDTDGYPEYSVTFEGSLIVDPPQIVRGVHTVEARDGSAAFTVDVSHNDTDGGPNLTVRFDRKA